MSEQVELPTRVLRDQIAPPQVGYVEAHEEAEAKAMIDKIFVDLTGKPFGYRTTGYYLFCKIYVRPDEIKTIQTPDGPKTLWRPPVATEDDKYQSCTALVCGIGPGAYTGLRPDGTKRFPEGPWCRVGDWITIPRSESFLVSYRGVAMAEVPDDRVLGVVEDPTDVAPIQQSYKA